MDIRVLSRAALKQTAEGKHFPNTALIEIAGEIPFIIFDFDSFDRRLKLCFDDVIGSDSSNSMTRAQAQEIVAFVSSLPKNIDAVYVSCEAGISRSPAIAAALYRFFGMDDNIIWDNPFYHPNIHCYRLVLDAIESVKPSDNVKTRSNGNGLLICKE